MAISYVSPPMRVCITLSLSFTLVYTAYLAIQNLQSSLNKEANLGVASLSVLYGTIIIFGTQAPTFIKYFGPKRILLAAWVIHILYTSSNFYPTWYTLIPSSALLGAIAGPMWTSQGLYISSAGEQYASLHGITSEKGLHSVLSKFNGIFFMAYEATQVTGNLISSFVLSAGTSSNISAKDIAMCGANDCPTAATSANDSSNSTSTDPTNGPDHSVVYILLGIFLAFNVCGFLTTFLALPVRSGSDASSSSTCGELMSCFKMVISPKMIPLLPLFMAQAMAIGVLYADYTKAYISCALGVEWVGFIMASYGILSAIFAISINSLAKFVGRFSLFTIAILLDTATLLIMLLWQPTTQTVVAIFFLVPALSGISEGIMQAQFNTIIAQLFKDNMSPAFATYHTSKAASFTLTFTLSLFVCLRYRLYIAIGLYALGLVGYFWTEFQVKRGDWYQVQQQDSNSDDDKSSIKINGVPQSSYNGNGVHLASDNGIIPSDVDRRSSIGV